MLDKLRKKLLGEDPRIEELKNAHKESIERNTKAREKLLELCETQIPRPSKKLEEKKTLCDIIYMAR